MLKLIRSMAYLPCTFFLLIITSASFADANESKPSPFISFHSFYNGFKVVSNIPVSVYSSKYNEWKLADAGISFAAFQYAVKGFEYLQQHFNLSSNKIITIIDFSRPSSEERLFTINLETGRILFKTLVAHGRNTGQQWATAFSNQESSYESSLGFYITGETYTGNNGYSLRLKGCEKGFNDKALERNIVLHGADYVSDNFIRQNGYLGRSHGCPAVPVEESDKIINTIKGGTCLFIFHPDKKYLKLSRCINH